jgi:tetratricopeptide (TPR) repeat protein
MEVLFLFILLILYTVVRVLIALIYDEGAAEKRQLKPGCQLMEQKKFLEALHFFNQYLDHNPRHARAFAYRGQCQLALENFHAATSDSTRACSFSQTIPEAYLSKGIALYRLDRLSEALLELDKAVWHLKDNPSAYRWRGMARTRLEQMEKAEMDFRKAVELGDEHASYYLLRRGKLEI